MTRESSLVGSGQSKVVLLLTASALSACTMVDGSGPDGGGADERAEVTRTTRSSLVCEGTIKLPSTPQTGSSGIPRMACGPTRCFGLSQQEVASQRFLVGRRLTYSGLELDLPGIVLSTAAASLPSQTFAVTAFGDDFMLAVQTDDGAGPAIAITKIRGVDGAYLPQGAIPPTELGTLVDIVPVGQAVFVLHGASGAYKLTRYRAGDALVTTALPASFTKAALIPGDNQLLVAGGNQVVRLHGTTGALLDASPIALSKYEDTPAFSDGFYEDGNYVLFFHHGNSNGVTNLRSVRVRASDGVLVDAWDEFLQAPGSRAVCETFSCMASAPVRLSVAKMTSGGAVVFVEDYGKLYGLRVDKTGARTDGATTSAATVVHPDDGNIIEYTESGGFLTSQYSFPRRLVPGTNQLPTTLAPPDYGTYARTQFQPILASNGTDFLAVWREGSSNPGPVYAARISAQTGAVVGDPVSLGDSYTNDPDVSIATDGSDYFLAWRGTEQSPATLNYGLLRADGSTDFRALEQGFYGYSGIGAAFDGERYLIAYVYEQTQAVRIDKDDLSVIDATPLTLMAGSTASLSVAANTTPTPAQRTFLVGYKGDTSMTTQGIRAATGTVLSSRTLTGNPINKGHFLTSDGTDFLALWADASQVGKVFAARIDQLTTEQVGSNLDVFGTLNTSVGYGSAHPRVAFDGSSYLFVGVDGRQIVSRRYSKTLEALDASNQPIATLDPRYATKDPTGLALATNASGRSLVLYSDVDAERLGVQLHGRFIDPNGSCPDIETGGTGGGGSGGSSGSGGSGTGGAGTGGVSNGGTGSGGSGGAASGGNDSGGADGVGGTAGGTSSGGSSGSASSGGATSGDGGNQPGQAGAGSEDGAGGSKSAASDTGSSGGCAVSPSTSRGGAVPQLALLLASLLVWRRRSSVDRFRITTRRQSA